MTDTQKTLICPACGSEMTKLFVANKGISIDICANGCGGIYFDNQEIQEFSNPDEDISEIKKLLEGKNFMPVDENQVRVCPSCKTPMAKTNALGIQIDTCYKCGGIFLDNGEFELVKSKFKKRQKVQPIDVSDINKINLNDFYNYKQESCNYRGINFLLSILLTPLHRRNRFF